MLLEKFRDSAQELGFFNLVLYKLHGLLGFLSAGRIRIIKYYFYSQPVAADPMVKNAAKRNIKVLAVEEDSPLRASFPRPQSVISDRFGQGAICYTAVKNGEFVGYIWFTEGGYREDEVRCTFSPRPEGEAAWDFDVYVAPDYRLTLAFPMLWDRVNAHLSENGFRWSTSRISAFNPNSLSVHKKMGAKYRGYACFLCLWKLEILVASLSPYIGVSIARAVQIKVPGPGS